MFKNNFPLLSDPELVYLDSASSAQKPESVIRAMDAFLRTSYANIHRGSYDLSMESSHAYDRAKEKVAEFLGGEHYAEIVFTYNATYAMNLIARSLVKSGILKK
jgi:cysteine desulfurase/selenocysteine lyase